MPRGPKAKSIPPTPFGNAIMIAKIATETLPA
jgi:hypothetical protein